MRHLKSAFSRIAKFEIVLVGLAALALLFSVRALVTGSNFSTDSADLGQVTSLGGDVRKHLSDSAVWSPVSIAAPVMNGETLFTSPLSVIDIKILNGAKSKIPTTIVLEPETIASLSTKSGAVLVGLQNGTALLGLSEVSLFQIDTANTRFFVHSHGEARARIIQRRSQNELNASTLVQAVTGDVTISLPGQAATIKLVQVGEIVEVTKSAITPRALSATLFGPTDGTVLWLPAGKALKLQWSFDQAGPQVSLLEIARDAGFTTITSVNKVSGEFFELDDTHRPEGSFYWRIKNENGTKLTVPSLLTVYGDVPPMPLAPADHQDLFIPKTKSSLLEFAWDDKVGSTDWFVQVATETEFHKPVFEGHVQAKHFEMPSLAAGSYFWRVRGTHALRTNAPYSRESAFTIHDGGDSVAAPILAKNSIDYILPRAVFKKGARSPASENDPDQITWASVQNAASYEVEVAADDAFTNSVKTNVGNRLAFTPQDVRPGVFFARVRAKLADGRITPASTPVRYTSLVTPPDALRPEIKSINGGEGRVFKLSWSAREFVGAYELQWGADPEFKKMKSFTTTDLGRDVTVTHRMDYFYRVRALAIDGTPVSDFSKTLTASFSGAKGKTKPLIVRETVNESSSDFVRTTATRDLPGQAASAPPLKLPAKKERNPSSIPKTAQIVIPVPAFPSAAAQMIIGETEKFKVDFKWHEVPNTQLYELQISEDNDFTKIVGQAWMHSPRYEFRKDLPEGHLFWRIRAQKTKAVWGTWSDSSDFNLIFN